MSMSDHHAMVCEFVFPGLPPRASRWRYNLTLLQNSVYCSEFRQDLVEFISINRNSITDARLVWNSIKGHIQSRATSSSSYSNKTELKTISRLEILQADLTKQQHLHFDNSRQELLHKTNSDLNKLNLKRGEFLVHRVRQSHYSDGGGPGFLLANKIRTNERLAEISSIKNQDGTLVSEPHLVNLEFQSLRPCTPPQ